MNAIDHLTDTLIVSMLLPLVGKILDGIILHTSTVSMYLWAIVYKWYLGDICSVSIKTVIDRFGESHGDYRLYSAILEHFNKNVSTKISNCILRNDNVLLIPTESVIIGDYLFTNNETSDEIEGENKSIGKEVSKSMIISSYKKSEIEIREYIQEIYNSTLKDNVIDYPCIIYRYSKERQAVFENVSKKSFNDVFIDNKQTIIDCVNKYNNNPVDKFNILLHGEPGCGKTSFIQALALETKRDLYIANLSDFTKVEELHKLFFDNNLWINEIAKSREANIIYNKKLLVFEDFDADNKACKTRKTDKKEKNDKNNKKISVLSKSSFGMTLSELLNVFDGLLRPQDVICVFTTNHISNIDPAFIRDGRINLNIELKRANKQCIVDFAKYKYPKEIIVEETFDKYDMLLQMSKVENAYQRATSYDNFLVLLDEKLAEPVIVESCDSESEDVEKISDISDDEEIDFCEELDETEEIDIFEDGYLDDNSDDNYADYDEALDILEEYCDNDNNSKTLKKRFPIKTTNKRPQYNRRH
jgi:hypothetical protein